MATPKMADMRTEVKAILFFYYWWGGTKSLGSAATSGLLYKPQMIWRLAGETEVLGENLPQRHFVHHKSHMTRPGARTPSRRGGKPATNRLSYGKPHLL
jgi:hypothetical protein